MWNSGLVSIWRNVDGARTDSRQETSTVVIGSFDGVHRGHRHVIATARSASPAREVVTVTFDPLPRAVLRPDTAPATLSSVERRVELLHESGADDVRVLAFSQEMARWSAEEFIDRVIVADLRAEAVIVGSNFRFGARASGDVALLGEAGRSLGFTADGVDLIGDGEAWSSTRIRAAIAEADLTTAAAMLGRWYSIDGIVSRGDQRGRDLGFPTANVLVPDGRAVPPDGVYAGWFVDAGQRWGAAISIGTNPTFRGTERRVESYVLDQGHALDLYGHAVRVELVQHVRDMATFDSVDALVRQMHDDVDVVRSALERVADWPAPWLD